MLKYDSQLYHSNDTIKKSMDDMEEYLNFIYPIFKITKDATVLEVGPGPGWHTDMLLSYKPKELTCVEPNLESSAYNTLHDLLTISTGIIVDKETHLTEFFTILKLVNADIFDYLKNPIESVDVVVACGVLYHFHSPFHFLEVVVNNANPKHLILESLNEEETLNLSIENVNEQAQRIVKNNYKHVKMCFVAGTKYIIQAMDDLGYTLVEHCNYNEAHFYKAKLCIMHFERIDNE